MIIPKLATNLVNSLVFRFCTAVLMMFTQHGVFAQHNTNETRDFNIGFSRVTTVDPMGSELKVSIWYPTMEPNKKVKLGPFAFSGTKSAPIAPGQFGLVMISHGMGGSDLGHRTIAVELAQSGFIAAAVLHPRDNFRDDSGSGHRIVWEGRPRQISSAVDYLTRDWAYSGSIDSRRVGVFGFSAGGYTAIALLGPKPDFSRLLRHCQTNGKVDPVCRYAGKGGSRFRKIMDNEFKDVFPDVVDNRFCSAVVADPFAIVFSEKEVRSHLRNRILIYLPEIENEMAYRFHGKHVYDSIDPMLKHQADLEVIPGAHHYSFISPFPHSLRRALGELADDFGEFDRVGFHHTLSNEVSQFFEKTLFECKTGS